MFERKYSDGDQIYGQGDPGDAIYLVLRGKVALCREEESEPVRTVVQGEAFGQNGVLRGHAREYSAVAVGDVLIGLIRRIDVLEQLEKTPDVWFPSVLEAFKSERVEDLATTVDIETFAPPKEIVSVPSRRLVLHANGGRAAAHIDGHGVTIEKLPFRVGRATRRKEKPNVEIDLALKDSEPYMLSRRHFVIDAAPDQKFLVRDEGSHNGTIVNGQKLGRDGAGRMALLIDGMNDIVAGTDRSEFRFLLRVSTD